MIFNVKIQKTLCISLLFLIFVTLNCSGAQIGKLYGISTPNTNPTPDYADPLYPVIKGGWLYHNNTIPGQLGANADGKAIGEACSYSLLYLVGWGDSSIQEAKKAGKISKVSSVEYEQTGVLWLLYHSFCTIASGSSDSLPAAPTEDSKTISEPAGKKPVKKGK